MHINYAQDNRRCAYRVSLFTSDHLQLQLHGQHRQWVPDRISDVSSHGARICFENNHIPDLATGDEISVRIISSGLQGQVNLAARVTFTDDNLRGRIFGLKFLSNTELIQRSNCDLLQIFNRRSAYRGVEPEASARIHATVQAQSLDQELSAAQRTATVHNISTTGVCLRVDEDLGLALEKGQRLGLLLKIPGTVAAREYCAQIRNISDKDERAQRLFGCHFDWSGTINAMDAIEELAGYTMERLAQEQADVRH